MGKRKGRKNKYKIYDLTSSEFTSHICEECRFCGEKGNSNIDFCYDNNYVSNPHLFVRSTLERLKEFGNWLKSCGYSNFTKAPDNDIQHVLENAFCPDCQFSRGGSQCEMIVGCLEGFRKQLRQTKYKHIKDLIVKEEKDHRGRKDKKKQKNKYKKQKKVEKQPAIPYFFCNESFALQIEEFLNGDNNREQDKVERPSGNIKTDSSGAT